MRVRADVFPATVTLISSDPTPTTFTRVRVVVTMDQVLVFKDSPSGPALALSERLASYSPGVPRHRRTRSTPESSPSLTTDSGATLTFSRQGGCGCGSRLKTLDPFSFMDGSLPQAASSRDL